MPNLFLIGAAKSGSSSLYSIIEKHPDIGSYGMKEPNIFNTSSPEMALSRLSELGLRRPDARYRIDGSVNYSQIPRFSQCPKNIFECCGPSCRFIYIMRNPVERLISHFFWKKQQFGGVTSIDRVFELDPQLYFTSCFDIQIEEYLKFFSIDRFYFLTYEDFIVRQAGVSEDIFHWLGLPILEQPETSHRGATKKTSTREMRGGALLDPLWRQTWLRNLVKSAVPENRRKAFMRMFTVERPRVDPTREEKRTLLNERFLDSIARTEALTGLDLESWRRAYD